MSKYYSITKVLFFSALLLAPVACDEEGVLTEERVADFPTDLTTLPAERNACAPCKTCAIIYEHGSFEGDSRIIGDGEVVSWIGNRWNDVVSSVKVSPGCTLHVYEHGSFGGARTFYTENISWIGRSWNDRISGYKCSC